MVARVVPQSARRRHAESRKPELWGWAARPKAPVLHGAAVVGRFFQRAREAEADGGAAPRASLYLKGLTANPRQHAKLDTSQLSQKRK